MAIGCWLLADAMPWRTYRAESIMSALGVCIGADTALPACNSRSKSTSPSPRMSLGASRESFSS